MTRRAVRAGRQRGFSLVEVIVAFVLLAGALTLLLGAMTRATRQVRDADVGGRAALHAQSLLDQVGVGVPLEPGTSEGVLEDGRYRWTLQVADWTDHDPAMAAGAVRVLEPGEPRMLEIELVVAWGEGDAERLQLHSLRWVRPPLRERLR